VEKFGIVYSLEHVKGSNGWGKTNLYTFQGDPNPNNPVGGLTIAEGGYVLGTASSGGSSRAGAVFRLMPSAQTEGGWNLVDLYSFGRPPDGGFPFGNLISKGGRSLYGMTQVGGTGQACHAGCGTVFEVTP
jgi:hypothetical protein